MTVIPGLGSSGVAVVGLLVAYALSFLPRQLGGGIEAQLWTGWDGAPITRMLRWQDRTLDYETKRRARARAEQVSGVALYSEAKESEDPDEADDRISRAITQVRATVRREDPEGLWARHNAEYGLNRNLLGSRWLWLALSVLGTLICAGAWYFYGTAPLLVAGFVLEVSSIILAYLLGWHLLPRSARTAADRYAESLLGSFLVGANGERDRAPAP